MKNILILFGMVVGSIVFSSCNKCTTCTKEGEEDEIECKESQGPWESVLIGDSYESEVNYWREQGYECD
jgi:hypothetical protein